MNKGFNNRTACMALAMAMVLVASVAFAGQESGAQMTLPVDHYKFGTVPEGTLVTYDFEVRNTGAGDLAIGKAVSSCSCLTIRSYDELIFPGAAGRVSVTLDTSGYGGGEVSRRVTLRSNDPAAPQVDLMVSGQVDKTYVISSEIVKLNGRAGERVSETVKIFPEEKYDFKVVGVRTKQGKYIECSFEEIVEGGRCGCLMTIECNKREKGLFFDKIYIDTDSDVVPEISIGVFGKMEDA